MGERERNLVPESIHYLLYLMGREGGREGGGGGGGEKSCS